MVKTIRKIKEAGSIQVKIILDDGLGHTISCYTDVLHVAEFETAAQNATWAQINAAVNQAYNTIIKTE